MLLPISEITPSHSDGGDECPFNCVGCMYFEGITFGMISCSLDKEAVHERD